MQDAQRSLQHAASVAQSLSPYAVLARGYTLTERNGVPCSVEALHPGEAVTLRGAKAAAECRQNDEVALVNLARAVHLI